jgi:hypothetical protein
MSICSLQTQYINPLSILFTVAETFGAFPVPEVVAVAVPMPEAVPVPVAIPVPVPDAVADALPDADADADANL